MWMSWGRWTGADVAMWTRKLHAALRPCQVSCVSATPPLLTAGGSRAASAEGAGIYRIVPLAVAIPKTVPDVQHLMRWAAVTGTALVPRGAGSGIPGGSVGHGVIVDLSHGFGDVLVDPDRRTARAGAAVTWAQLTEAARASGLRLPPDPSSGAFASCGGMVATNAAGPRSLRYGSVRRWVEAGEIVGADGGLPTLRRGAGGAGGFLLAPARRRLDAWRLPQ